MNNNIDNQIIKNMFTHYSGLMKDGTTDFGQDFMSKSIFNAVDTNRNGIISQDEIDIAKPNLESFIRKSIEQDDFYANLYFGDSYTKASKDITPQSDKTVSNQIVENNLKQAVDKIIEYAQNNPNDETIQKYATKLKELVASGNVKLVDIKDSAVAGRANKNDAGTDSILIDNHDSINNLNPDYLLQTLLHELRHTMETDKINSKAEELEAETTAREFAKKISGNTLFNTPIDDWIQMYNVYADASPGTCNIPENTGIAVWYKPEDVTMKDNILSIKSSPQEDLQGATIEDNVQFGDEKDENGKSYPISAKRIIKNSSGEIIQTIDYGEYDKKERKFNYQKVYFEQVKMKNNSIKSKIMNFGLG